MVRNLSFSGLSRPIALVYLSAYSHAVTKSTHFTPQKKLLEVRLVVLQEGSSNKRTRGERRIECPSLDSSRNQTRLQTHPQRDQGQGRHFHGQPHCLVHIEPPARIEVLLWQLLASAIFWTAQRDPDKIKK